MNRMIGISSFRAFATCLAVAVGGFYLFRQQARDAPRGAPQTAQCAHWCVRRCCELLGAPVELPTIMERLPPREGGHSMLEMAQLLRDIGFQVDGLNETIESILSKPTPRIVHLADPDHFVVVVGATPERVHLFDSEGRRTSRPVKDFLQKWTGRSLLVRRAEPLIALPAFTSVEPKDERLPRIQFETLFTESIELAVPGKTCPRPSRCASH